MVTTDLKATERPKNTASIRTYLTSVREVKKKVYLMYILFEIKVRENFLKWTDKKEIWLEINAAFDKLE